MQIIKSFRNFASSKNNVMIERTIKDKILAMAQLFPVVSLTGVRQSGKSTLLKNCFPHHQYVSLEDPDIRMMAESDPRGFLLNFGFPLIIDEAQNVPVLFSYIQTIVDEHNESGMYILSGSQNFLLMENISQSLAGRAAILKMTPFSITELKGAELLTEDLNELMFTGGYPRIYDKGIPPSDYFPSYLQTYIERDVLLLKNVGKRTQFQNFLRLCAARAGQLLNLSALANDADISVPTAQTWLSILGTSNVVFLLQPYYKNFNKRIIKAPKLYFYDTGLLSSLLGIRAVEQMKTHFMRGEIFENLIVSECTKFYFSKGIEPQLYFWRDSNGNEVDLLVEDGDSLSAYEIKSSATLKSDFFKGLKSFEQISNGILSQYAVVYGGLADYRTSDGTFISWRNWRNDFSTY